MAKLRTKPILIPEKVNVTVNGQELNVKGPLGELKMKASDHVRLELKDNTITVHTANGSKLAQGIQGTTRTLILNMIKGVTEGYTKTLVIQGTGYRAQPVSGGIQLFVGYTRPVTVHLPPEIKFEIQTVKSADKGDLTHIILKSIDKQLLGDIAAKIRKIRPPDPYKHKGIRYADEVLRKKVGKRAVGQTS
ncbi:MAG: 50S ribosomal protein L6 [candidate division WOR-3 bacterium]|nr:50S ribosomal protein L6 [candidate division WOR-3 bacterium]